MIEPGEPATLRFRVRSSEAAPAVEAAAMQVMIFRFPAGSQWRGAPRAEADGAFSVTFTPPQPGEYRFLLAADALGAPLGTLPHIRLRAARATGPRDGGRP